MAEEKKLVVRSQLIPLNNIRLVLPNTAIAEVISFLKPTPVKTTLPWVLGMADWRGLQIPLISFETASRGETVAVNKRCRVIVLNALSGKDTMPFYGLIAQGIPRLMALDNENIIDAPNNKRLPFVLRNVVLDGHHAFIPNQTDLEVSLIESGLSVRNSA